MRIAAWEMHLRWLWKTAPQLQSSFCPQIKFNSQLSCCASFLVNTCNLPITLPTESVYLRRGREPLWPGSHSCSMRDLIPWPGIEPGPLHWELGVILAAGLPRKSPNYHPFYLYCYCITTLPSPPPPLMSPTSLRYPQGCALDGVKESKR